MSILTSSILNEEAIKKGLRVKEDGDHITELWQGNNLLARFPQTGVTIENILKEVEIGKYDN
ncbi:MAG: hypothetical protein MUP81_01055 [Dehalococcoidia bacterium]|nr:hypothetical protein [Dehalococcoidia bacterium]